MSKLTYLGSSSSSTTPPPLNFLPPTHRHDCQSQYPSPSVMHPTPCRLPKLRDLSGQARCSLQENNGLPFRLCRLSFVSHTHARTTSSNLCRAGWSSTPATTPGMDGAGGWQLATAPAPNTTAQQRSPTTRQQPPRHGSLTAATTGFSDYTSTAAEAPTSYSDRPRAAREGATVSKCAQLSATTLGAQAQNVELARQRACQRRTESGGSAETLSPWGEDGGKKNF